MNVLTQQNTSNHHKQRFFLDVFLEDLNKINDGDDDYIACTCGQESAQSLNEKQRNQKVKLIH